MPAQNAPKKTKGCIHTFFVSAVENDLRQANNITKEDLKTEWLEDSDSTALEVVSSLHMQSSKN